MTRARIASPLLSAEIDSLGAQLMRLQDGQGRDLLWDGDPAIWKSRAPILFPIVGGLKDGAYRQDGKTYHLPRHGLARTRDFALAATAPERALFRLTADDETRAVYPFDFVLELEFRIDQATLVMTARIENRGDAMMPASFGFHPAFRWPLPYGAPRAAHRITFAQAEPAPIRRLDDAGLILPQPQATPVSGQDLALDDALFAADAMIFDRLHSQGLRYGAPGAPQLDIAFDGMPYLGLWTKPGAPFLCIEPWFSMASPVGWQGEFAEKPGVLKLAPGASRDFVWRATPHFIPTAAPA